MDKIKYLLFDLDGTLLHFDMTQFISQYLNMIKKHFRDIQQPDRVPSLILQGTELMLRNEGERYNVDVFLEYFSEQVQLSLAVVWERFLNFYTTDFDNLGSITRSDQQARGFLLSALGAGYQLVLATQPVFPLVAIQRRLRWAGLEDIPFELITHIENMHACKPSPVYFREILKTIHADAEECLMIGNEAATDMASGRVGIKTFFLMDKNGDDPPEEADYSGNFDDLAAMVLLAEGSEES
jgi:FMN phosphatase YigB (HAD superfamily)